MSWESKFIDRLWAAPAQALDYVWIIEILQVGSVPFAGNYRIASHAGYGDALCIGLKGVSISGSRLSMASWSSTVGEFAVVIAGDVRPILSYTTRGTWLRVLCGFAGWAEADFQPVALGRVANITGAPPQWVLRCWDWKSALRSRNDPANPALFYNVQDSTTTADGFAYTANTTTAFDVASNTEFARETGGTGYIKVAPDGGTPFYLPYSAKPSSTRFTVGTVNKYATTQANFTSATPSLDVVTECAYLSGHPLAVIYKMLASTGAGTNGPGDVYPAGWGWGLPFYLLDLADMEAHQNRVMVTQTGSWNVELLVEAPEDDGLSWVEGWARPLGIFLSTRQGHATVRCIAAGTWASAVPGDPASVITDDDILWGQRIEWECWDGEYQNEYQQLRTTSTEHDTTALTETGTLVAPVTLPAKEFMDEDLSASIWSSSDSVAMHDEVHNRLERTRLRIPEKVRMWVTIKFALLTPGDLVFLSTSRLHGREESAGAYDARACLVTEVSPDYINARCRIALFIQPTSEEAWAV